MAAERRASGGAAQRAPRPSGPGGREAAPGYRGKRAFDVVVAGVGLVLSAPVQGLVAAAVVADSPGPALFRQTRVGLGGVPFTIYKFRTMEVAPITHESVPPRAASDVTGSDDPRITRVGRVLRATKLDELPQLVNILRGDMSLVGPRPELPRYVALWDPAVRPLILSVRPGLTDPASVAYRREGEELAAAADPEAHYVGHILPRKVAMYADYARGISLRSDLAVLAATVRAVLTG